MAGRELSRGRADAGPAAPRRVRLASPRVFTRLLLTLCGIAAFSTVISLALHDRSLSRDLRAGAERRVETAVEVVRELSRHHQEVLFERYTTLSSSPQLRALLDLQDPPTLEHFARTILARHGAARIAFLDAEGGLTAGAGEARLDPLAGPIRERGLVASQGRVYAVVAVPLHSGDRLVGHLLAFEPLGPETLARWSKLSGARVVVGPGDRVQSDGALVGAVAEVGDLELCVVSSLESEGRALARSRWNLLAAGGIGLAIAFVAAFFVSRGLVEPILRLVRVAERVGAGDFVVDVERERPDEIGDVGRAFGRMADDLRTTLAGVTEAADRVEGTAAHIKHEAERVAEATASQVTGIHDAVSSMQSIGAQVEEIASRAAASVSSLDTAVAGSTSSFRELGVSGDELNRFVATLSKQVEEAGSAIEEMAANARQMSANSKSLAAAADETSRAMEEMASATRRVDENAVEGGQLSQRVVDAADRGRQRVLLTVGGMEVIREATQTAQGVVASLSQRVGEIAKIVNLIDDVNEETGLLAFNASIIAAQAGERGRSFSVVAEQMKALAERVRAGTLEIGSVIDRVEAESANAVQAIDAGLERVEAGVKLGAEAETSLGEIIAAARESVARMADIGSLMAEQAQAGARVAHRMDEVRGGVSQMQTAEHEQGKLNEVVVRISREMRETATEVGVATQDQASATSRIGENVQAVRQEVEQVNRALQDQMDAFRRAVSCLDEVDAHTSSNQDSVRRMEQAVGGLLSQAERLREAVSRFRV